MSANIGSFLKDVAKLGFTELRESGAIQLCVYVCMYLFDQPCCMYVLSRTAPLSWAINTLIYYFNFCITIVFHQLPTLPQTAVKSIKKQHLVELRTMANPPIAVKNALESICLLLGENAPDWKAIRQIIVRENFISTIVNFSTEDVT